MQRVALVAAVAAVALSGCFGFGSQRLSEEEARAVTQDALADFTRDFFSADGGALRLVRGEFGGETENPVGGDVTFETEWGSQGRSRVSLVAGGGGASYDIAIHCSPERTVVSFGQQHYERRPTQGSCLESVQSSDDPLGIEAVADHTIAEVRPHRDGSVTAILGEDGGNTTVEIDEKGRLERMDFSGSNGGGSLRAEYGARRAIEMPQASQRLPALVYGAGQFDGQAYTWSALSATEDVPMAEVEVRIVDQQNTTVATFPLQGGDQQQNGFTFELQDDGDGRFGQGDSFTVRGDAWQQDGQFDVLVWDTWAGAEVGDIPVPMPWLTGVAGLAIVAALRRR